jgi:hypothetical protein
MRPSPPQQSELRALGSLRWFLNTLGVLNRPQEDRPAHRFGNDDQIRAWMEALEFETGHRAFEAARKIPQIRRLLHAIQSLEAELEELSRATAQISQEVARLERPR